MYSGSTEASLRQGLQSHFYAKGQACDIGRGTLINDGSYEYRYTCTGSVSPTRYCVTEAECQEFARQGFAVDRSFVGVPGKPLRWSYHKAIAYEKREYHRLLIKMDLSHRIGGGQFDTSDYIEGVKAFFVMTGKSCKSKIETYRGIESAVFSYSC
ncbi:hypothetical protein SAMN04488036_104353 [Shimia haliotis]|uniref:Uncharacterized protein n=1 Tax=Shimia haliotis TaxID=1280847 RepID=A0A1I4EMI4_9RHOB|nr:hypothetical protein SAMN04488036_104353 [Shimia haliotis]